MMIWVDGRIVADDELKVSVLDRTFEHGLGLFETLRTWGGRAPLLDRHLARLARSAGKLAVPLDPSSLPSAGAVIQLLRAEGIEGDGMLRITLSGGLSASHGSTLWMRAMPLPPATREGGVLVAQVPWPVFYADPLARFKSLNYWSRRMAAELAPKVGVDELLSSSQDGKFWEGTRTNLFVVRGETMVTPTYEGPIVPGIMRGLVIELVESQKLIEFEEDYLSLPDLESADEIFLTNAVRGIIPVARMGRRELVAPGPWTSRVRDTVSGWLYRAGEAS